MDEQEQRSGCERCTTWEEDMYWKHFNSMHFFLFLPKDFHHHLVLPAKFAENTKAKLPDKVSLIGPSATMWDIQLIKKTDNTEFGGDGWKEFVKAYDLEENDLLIFKYKKNSSFEVLIFDPESSCEKEASYFVKQCRHLKKDECENEKKRTLTKAFSVEVIEDEDNEDDDHNDSEFVVTKKSRNDVNEELGRRKSPQTRRKSVLACSTRGRGRPKKKLGPCESHSKSKAQSENEAEGNGATKEQTHVSEREQNTLENGGSVVEIALSHKPTEKKRVVTRSSKKLVFQSEKEPEENGLVHEVIEEEPEENGAAKELSHGSQREQNTLENGWNVLETIDSHKSTEKNGSPKKLLMAQSDSAEKKYSSYKSNRRRVTETEKENALQRAYQVLTEKGFVSVMRRSAVYTRFYLSIPAEWMKEHLPLRDHEVALRMGEKTWVAMFCYKGIRGGGLTGSGWKNFALDNFLEEFDVCHFMLATEKEEDDIEIILDVEIFRVIPDIVPPTPVPRSKLA